MRIVLSSAKVIDEVKNPSKWLSDQVPKFGGKILKASSSARISLSEYPQEQYLFTHSTIVSSVGTEAHKPWYVKPECSQFVNANGDCWSHGVIEKTHPTFIGSPNYLEHVQVPSLRKGWIVDATVRQVPDSLYTDILVATDRIHKDLVADIESGRMKTMSMGALVQYTQCTCCGNVSFSERDACDCVRTAKNTYFKDENGVERIIAELCGHEADPPSNRFIEASWVKDPAFRGAVTRSIINPSKDLLSKLALLEKQGKVVDTHGAMKKVAYAIFMEGPQYDSVTYPPFFTEQQQKSKSKEDHSLESGHDEDPSDYDEMSRDFSVFSGSVYSGISNSELDGLLIARLKQAGIYFTDVFDFIDLYQSMFSNTNPERMNALIGKALRTRVIQPD